MPKADVCVSWWPWAHRILNQHDEQKNHPATAAVYWTARYSNTDDNSSSRLRWVRALSVNEPSSSASIVTNTFTFGILMHRVSTANVVQFSRRNEAQRQIITHLTDHNSEGQPSVDMWRQKNIFLIMRLLQHGLESKRHERMTEDLRTRLHTETDLSSVNSVFLSFQRSFHVKNFQTYYAVNLLLLGASTQTNRGGRSFPTDVTIRKRWFHATGRDKYINGCRRRWVPCADGIAVCYCKICDLIMNLYKPIKNYVIGIMLYQTIQNG
jgi:hypothetical protein